MTAALLSGVVWATDRPVPLNVTGDLDTAGVYGIDGPDACHCPAIPGEHTEADCSEPPCPTCRGNGGWQQHDGLIVECPRGCMADGGQR